MELLTLGPTADTGSTQCVNITVYDDEKAEPEETFSVELEAVLEVVTIGSNGETSVTIRDYSDCKF